MKPIKKLEGKTVAIVGMGKSWFDYNLAKSHGSHFDEVWAINSVASVIFKPLNHRGLKKIHAPGNNIADAGTYVNRLLT